MGLSFLYPAFLLGTLAAAVPVVIHLIYRRRALVHRFPAVRFLLLADKRTARKFRLHQWLLLALRMLAILLLVLVLARPRVLGSDVYAADTLPAQATVIMVDNSLSMQYLDGQETRFQRAKTLAAELVQKLRPQDSAAVLPLVTSSESADGFFTSERSTLQEQLAAIQPRHAAVDMTRAFQRAFTLLQHNAAPRHRLVLLSDFTVHGWEDFHLTQFEVVPQGLELYFVRLGDAQHDANLLVESIRIAEPPLIAGVPLEVTVAVRNRGTEAVRNLRIDLLLGQTKIGEQLVDLAAHERVTVPFRITAPAAGLHWGEVRIANDRYPVDNRLYFALRTATPIRVLAVDGDPGTSLYESELFYLLSALQPARVLGQALFYAKPVTWEGLPRERLSDYQVIVLCNVEALAPQTRQRLQQFVRQGGGLLFFVGNRVNAAKYNAMLYRADTMLLPLALGEPVHRPEDQPMHIGEVELSHPALSIFAGNADLLRQGNFYRYLALRAPAAPAGVQVLLTLQDGHPLLVEKSLGRGKVLFFASSVDRDWTDLPTHTAYVPLLHGLLGHLAHLASAAQRPAVTMPEPASIPGRQADLGTSVTIRTPDAHTRVSRYVAEGENVVAQVTDYTVPGIYRLTTANGVDFLAVNATRAESDFAKLHQADLEARFRPLSLVMEDESTLGQTSAASQRPMWDVSGVLLFVLIAALITENVYANRL
jgi:hypothetical protein